MKNLLWDLDGTLTDPKSGIIRCIQFALREHGQFVPEEKDLVWCIGPPLHKTFQKLIPNISEAEAWKYVEKYRERFSTVGLFENELIPGVADLLNSLSDRKHFVATSKPHIFARRILDHFELSRHFQNIYGSELDGTRSDKEHLIAHILREENLNPENTFMIGDRLHDVEGARKNGVRALGVVWGYGGRVELEQAGAHTIFNSREQLLAYLKG